MLLAWGVMLGLCLSAPCRAKAESRSQAQQVRRSPFTYLFDTGTASAVPLSAEAVSKRIGWTLVPEDKVDHRFRGDAVFLNDRLAVVLRQKRIGAEVYARAPTGLKQRALLTPVAASGSNTEGLSTVTIIENSPGAVMLSATFRTKDGKSMSLTYRLTTGEAYLEVGAGEASGKLVVKTDARYVVVPEFFGDDMVFDAAGIAVDWIGLPAENFVLNLVDGGETIVMCVWQSNQQTAALVLSSTGPERVIEGVHIQCLKDKRIWVAFLEGAGIWHAQEIPEGGAGKRIKLDWRAPFPARWRADFVEEQGVAVSHNFVQESGEQLPTKDLPRAQRLVIYPLDRNPQTPLTTYCVVDIMRNTLGMGPCQYLLDLEGHASQFPPTPDEVVTWLGRLFKRKRETRSREEIEARLQQMVQHVGEIEVSILQYGDLAKELRELLVKERDNTPETAELLKELSTLIDYMGSQGFAEQEERDVTETAAELAAEIVGLIGNPDAPVRFQVLAAQLRAVGASQDRRLANSRMTARRLKQACLMAEGRFPNAHSFVTKLLSKVEGLLDKR